MRDLLRQSNTDLLLEIKQIKESLQAAAPFLLPELRGYCDWALKACEGFRAATQQNLSDLDLHQLVGNAVPTILPDVLSNTQVIKRNFEFFNQRLVSPVLRARASDRLCLKVLAWLHAAHARTQHIPAALSDGEFAIMPVPEYPTIYFLPPSAQHRLLYLPLFFHEFGHLLYACYKQEMDDLVHALQESITQLLLPRMQRDDRHDRKEEERRNIIVETWYEWTQELFCDAVGLLIGGPAFAHAFSMYFIMLGPNHFHLRLDDLERCSHPVTWLRIKLLADRARASGYVSTADALENSWSSVAQEMRVKEDYYGYYEGEFLTVVQQTLDDMLEEAGVITYCGSKSGSDESGDVSHISATDMNGASPVMILNQAWRIFNSNSQDYAAWEQKAVAALVQGD